VSGFISDRKAITTYQKFFRGRGWVVMARGRVKWFSEKRGYGFISREDGDDIFVHYSAIKKEGFRTLREGDEVEFEVSQGDKGLQATDVTVVE
jgi:CspA family cold shock protein